MLLSIKHQKERNPLRKASFIVIGLLLLFVISAVLSEVAIRVYQKINPSFIFPSSDYNRFRGVPHAPDYTFTLNGGGFKDVAFQKEKPAGSYRIIGIGDSFTFGTVPYENTYMTLLEKQLKAKYPNVEVYNMGISGIDVEGYLELLKSEAIIYQPDMVVCFFFTGNDYLEINKEQPAFYFIELLKYLFHIFPAQNKLVQHPGALYVDSLPTMPQNQYLELEKAYSHKYISYNLRFDSILDNTVRYIHQMDEYCKKRNIDFHLVILPDEVQVNKNLQAAIMKSFEDFSPRDFFFDHPNKLLTRRLESQGVSYVDLLTAFQQQSEKETLYRLQDLHFNLAGNQFVADTIGRWISDRLPLHPN